MTFARLVLAFIPIPIQQATIADLEDQLRMERATRDLDQQAKNLASQRQQLGSARMAATEPINPNASPVGSDTRSSPLPGALEITRDVAQARASREQLLQQLNDYERTNQ